MKPYDFSKTIEELSPGKQLLVGAKNTPFEGRVYLICDIDYANAIIPMMDIATPSPDTFSAVIGALGWNTEDFPDYCDIVLSDAGPIGEGEEEKTFFAITSSGAVSPEVEIFNQMEDYAVFSNPDDLRPLLEEKQKNIVFCAGCTETSFYELIEALKASLLYPIDADPGIVFEQDLKEKYNKAYRRSALSRITHMTPIYPDEKDLTGTLAPRVH